MNFDMKILIVSDSHLMYNLMDLQFIHKPDLSIHAGDSQLSFSDENMQYFKLKVMGNCDCDNVYKEVDIYDNILVTHGHLFGVKLSLEKLALEAKLNSCDIAIYGHSHIVDVRYYNNVWCINPGSVAQSRSQYPTTYMIFDSNTLMIDLFDAKTHKVIKTFDINKKT